MYFWSHSEPAAATPATPGRLSSGMWPYAFSPTTDTNASTPSRPGARYTEAGNLHHFFTITKGFRNKKVKIIIRHCI